MRGSSISILCARSFGTALGLPNRNLPGRNQWLKIGCGYRIRPRVNVHTDILKLASEHCFEAFRYPALLLSFWLGIRLVFGGNHGA